ncbi:hypothetical protein M3223_10925 [Paenibacillus pasadenensis]|uniref:hypothetical protein n=1 Tax=Paenibacillus pasadenensis TaxID=217090 RepID=UPI00203FCB1C|nr:hypothetical protein [Paenibacillus pasadenensis]MCM3747864.1 hypothetical protein [Paenibacillus pasadenensis]
MRNTKNARTISALRADSWSFNYDGGNFDDNWVVSFGPPGYVLSTAGKDGANVYTWTRSGKYYRMVFKKGGRILIGSNNMVLLGKPHRIIRLLSR